ncbi:MAG TPA: ATP-binding protein, partial [Phenylobacterium sp.]|nr:ATP-binding protein [Phenylobacterium sp.]
LADVAAGRHPGGSEVLRVRGEEERFLQITLRRYVEGGRPGALAILNDATRLKTMEAQFAQSQKMQAIGQLAGGIAHDFNNLLTAISGHCDLLLLRHGREDSDFADLEQIRQNANRAASLVEQLLAFSRKQTLKPEVLDLAALISQVEPLVRRAVGAGVTLSVDADPDLGVARLDSAQFEAALLNLVVNASDAVGQAGRITVEARRRDLGAGEVQGASAGTYLAICVADDGPGMDAEVASRAFEPFFTTKEVGKGTGLGLAQVYGFVRQCGGAVVIDSAPGQGCAVTLFLPAASGEAVGSADPEEDPFDEAGLAAHVLLVEDDPEVRAVTETLLADLGCQVTTASD